LTRFVLDASVALCWFFEGQKTAYTEAVLECLARGDEALVPVVWPLEVVNSLVVAARQKTITATQLETFVADLKELPVEVDLEASRGLIRPSYGSRASISFHLTMPLTWIWLSLKVCLSPLWTRTCAPRQNTQGLSYSSS